MYWQVFAESFPLPTRNAFMKTKYTVYVVLISMFTLLAGGLTAQQGGMQMPPNMQMPSPEEIQKMMEQQVTTMVNQYFPKGDEDGDGELTMDEYKKLYDIISSSMPIARGEGETDEEKAERLEKEFAVIDDDDDDALTKEELIHAFLNPEEMEAAMDEENAEGDDEDSEDGEAEGEDDEESEEEEG